MSYSIQSYFSDQWGNPLELARIPLAKTKTRLATMAEQEIVFALRIFACQFTFTVSPQYSSLFLYNKLAIRSGSISSNSSRYGSINQVQKVIMNNSRRWKKRNPCLMSVFIYDKGPVHTETFSCVFVLFQVMSWLFSIPLRTVNNTKTQGNVSVCMGLKVRLPFSINLLLDFTARTSSILLFFNWRKNLFLKPFNKLTVRVLSSSIKHSAIASCLYTW